MTQVQDAPAYEVVDETVDGEGRRNLVIIAVVAAVLLAAAGWFLLGGGGADSEGGFVVPSARKPAVTAPGKTVAKPVATLPPVSTVKLGRDPFKPQYIAPVPPAVVAPPVLTPGVGTDPGTGTGTGSAGGTGGTGGTGTGGTGTSGTGTAPVAKTYALKLERVDGSGSDLTAKFLVGSDKKIQYARAGSVFGKTQEIRLLSIQKGPNGGGTAVIQVGDDSPFDVSTSDGPVYVQ